MSLITKPLLAVAADMEKIEFPVWATPKIDGIRCLKINGQVVSRNFKLIPNHYIRTTLEQILPEGIDGEIIPTKVEDFGSVTSAVMKRDGEPDFRFCAFDYVTSDLEKGYLRRISDLAEWYSLSEPRVVVPLLPKEINTIEQLSAYEDECIKSGYEGVMIRKRDGKYKCGRSTMNEGILLKIKKFQDSEAEIIGFEEKIVNQNEAEKDAFGHTKRSTKKEGMVPAGVLGAMILKDTKTGAQFNVGSGFTDKLREEVWENQDRFLGRIVKYKFQPSGAKSDVPRFPVYQGIRDTADL